MNIDLRSSTRRMIEKSPAATEAWSFIEWLRAERYTDYAIDCHIRRLLFVMPQLTAGSSPPILRDRVPWPSSAANATHVEVPLFGPRRAYTRYLSAQGRLVREPDAPERGHRRRYDQYLIDVRACPSRPVVITSSRCVRFSRAFVADAGP